MGGHVGNAATFLVETLFGLYILVVMLRFLLQWVRADFYNPLSQFIVRATQLPLVPLRRVLPAAGGIDTASVVLLVALQFAELWIVTGILGQRAPAGALLVFSIAELLRLGINVFLFSILIQVVMSWINPGAWNPLLNVVHSLNEPLLAPARRLIPPMGGLDLSPIAVMVALQFASILLVGPLRQLAGTLG